jgi:hypothetical protein
MAGGLKPLHTPLLLACGLVRVLRPVPRGGSYCYGRQTVMGLRNVHGTRVTYRQIPLCPQGQFFAFREPACSTSPSRASYVTSPINMGIANRFRFVSPLKSCLVRSGVSPRVPKC